MTMLKRQFITDVSGKPIGVILPLEEFALIADTLEQRLTSRPVTEKLALMEQVVHDPLFLADLYETMKAFHVPDTEWWEPHA